MEGFELDGAMAEKIQLGWACIKVRSDGRSIPTRILVEWGGIGGMRWINGRRWALE